MKNLAKVEVMPEPRKPGRPRRILDLRKLDKIKVMLPESPERAIEDLLIFDARSLDLSTRQQLLRLLPELIHVRRAWKAEYMECGCLSCHRKRDWYGAGGLCEACHGRIYQRMLKRYRKKLEGRDLPAELEAFREALSQKFNAARRLLNGND
jgi:hypothetical protein